MRFDYLSEPISEAAPSGRDLDEDPEFSDYMLVAGGRLPARFFSPEGAPFDRSSIDLDAEVEAIAGLLAKTKDVRLLTLEARFQALKGELVGFSEAIQGLAIIVADFWDSFHPLPNDGDCTSRQNVIEGLEDQVQVILPLQFAPIIAAGRGVSVSYRNFLVATGKANARENEVVVPPDTISQVLSDERLAEGINAVYEALLAAMAALKRIHDTFYEKAGSSFTPNFDRLTKVLQGIVDLIVSNRPELLGADEPEQPPAEDGEAPAEAAGQGRPAAAKPQAIKTHAAAAAALRAAELYFLRREPSSPSMVLVHQARMLIGKPLVEALEALMPDPAERAVLRFDTGYRFDIDFRRMKSVTDDAFGQDLPMEDEAAPAAGEGGEQEAAPPEPEPDYRAATRSEASDLLVATEAFFRSAEPSSPIPILLGKARNYLNRDFSSILNEIIPRET